MSIVETMVPSTSKRWYRQVELRADDGRVDVCWVSSEVETGKRVTLIGDLSTMWTVTAVFGKAPRERVEMMGSNQRDMHDVLEGD